MSTPGGERLQYLRSFSCVIASSSKTFDFKDLRVQFTVRRGDTQTPNSADVRIYNLSPNTTHEVGKEEYTQISLSAGYAGNIGLIFRGTIVQFRKRRDNATDSYVDVTAIDGDEAYNFAPISASLAAGAKPFSIAAMLLTAMQRVGAVTQGYAPTWPQNGLIRGRVFYGMARDELRDFAQQNQCSWSIQDGALVFIPLRSYIACNVPLITPNSGLIGVPEQTQNGIKMRVLLNSNITIGQCVKLDTTINQLRFGLDAGDARAQARNRFLNKEVLNTPNPNGLYYVLNVTHHGDSRGNEWFSDLVCLAVDATVPSIEAISALTASAVSIPRYP